MLSNCFLFHYHKLAVITGCSALAGARKQAAPLFTARHNIGVISTCAQLSIRENSGAALGNRIMSITKPRSKTDQTPADQLSSRNAVTSHPHLMLLSATLEHDSSSSELDWIAFHRPL